MASTLAQNQAARRRRVMDTALALAADGGFDAVQMRDVASGADVALGTLYRYFPSKETLLVSILAEDVGLLAEAAAANPAADSTPRDRVVSVLRRAVKLHPARETMDAMVRALASAQPEVSHLVADVNDAMTRVITSAMHSGEPTERELAIARVLQQVWIASLLGWVGGVHPKSQIITDIESAANLLL